MKNTLITDASIIGLFVLAISASLVAFSRTDKKTYIPPPTPNEIEAKIIAKQIIKAVDKIPNFSELPKNEREKIIEELMLSPEGREIIAKTFADTANNEKVDSPNADR